jgi:hypothetical protein
MAGRFHRLLDVVSPSLRLAIVLIGDGAVWQRTASWSRSQGAQLLGHPPHHRRPVAGLRLAE